VASTVYSSLFVSAKVTVAGSVQTLYTVPTGKRAVLKEAAIQNVSGGVSGAALLDVNDYAVWQQLSVAAGAVFTVPLFEVFDTGDLIQALVINQPWTFRLSGYLLTLP
jgi:hypothetical protein